jgi:hypothetical protein
MKEGDLCIRGKASELIGIEQDAAADNIMAWIFGGGDTLVLCKDCTERGGGFDVEVYHEDQPEEER